MMSRVINRVLYPLNEFREGTKVGSHLRRLEQSQFFTPASLEALRREKLQRLLNHAYNNTVHYRKKFDVAGIHPSQIRDVDELHLIPPLTKQEIREELDALVASNFPAPELHQGATGGSTGSRTAFYRNTELVNCFSILRGVGTQW